MKTFLLPLSALVLLASSCKKSSHTQADEALIGIWELRHVVGGMATNIPPQYEPGNGNLLVFTDTTETRFDAGHPDGATVSYNKGSGLCDHCGGDVERSLPTLIYPGNVIGVFYEIKGDLLTVYIGTVAADGVIETYEKLPGRN